MILFMSAGRAVSCTCDSLVKDKTMKDFEIVFESHSDGCVAYPLSIRGIVASEEDTFEESLADVKMAFAFHLQTFGLEVIESDCPVLEAFVTQACAAV